LKKIKVTKRVATKVPWYEKPPLLFSAIAALLLIAGIAMGRFNAKSPDTTMLGKTGADSTQAVITLVENVDAIIEQEYETLLSADAPFSTNNEAVDPRRVKTLGDAADYRERMREYFHLAPVDQADSRSGGCFGFIAAENLCPASSAGEVVSSIEISQLASEFDPYTDFEVHRHQTEQMTLVAFIGKDDAVALARCGISMELPSPPPIEDIPKWQFWRKQDPPERGRLYAGSEITLYGDLRPEAMCACALPLSRLKLSEVAVLKSGVERPVHVLKATVH